MPTITAESESGAITDPAGSGIVDFI